MERRLIENKLTQLLIQAQERNEKIFIAIGTEYSLTRQLSHDTDLEYYPLCTLR